MMMLKMMNPFGSVTGKFYPIFQNQFCFKLFVHFLMLHYCDCIVKVGRLNADKNQGHEIVNISQVLKGYKMLKKKHFKIIFMTVQKSWQ
jgi:hypothetical protein